MKNKCMLIAALLLLSGTISAKVVLPPMFSDNMVLQQQADAPIWGEAKPMKAVKVTTFGMGRRMKHWLIRKGDGSFPFVLLKRVARMSLH